MAVSRRHCQRPSMGIDAALAYILNRHLGIIMNSLLLRRTSRRLILGLGLVLSLTAGRSLMAGTKLLRFPDIHDGQIVFCYGGDIWRASVDGGRATRLTAHPGLEVFPKFSPDGKSIAFTGQYDGDEQVYVMDALGGEPKQLTYYPANGPLPDRWGFDNQVYGWTPDGTSVLFRSMRHGWTLTDTRLYTVPLTGGLPKQLAPTVSGAGDFSPDGTKLVFSPLTRDFRTWKRYQGGWAQDLYTFDLASNAAQRLTEHARSDRDPMWIGDRIYFASDRSGFLNLYSKPASGGETTQETDFSDADVRWPSMGGDKIVFELQGELRVFDTVSREAIMLDITVPTDGLAARPRREAGSVDDMALSPHGKRVLIKSRGDIFSAPTKKGVIRNLTHSSGAHDKAAAWSPDGEWIAFISDRTGEEELYLTDAKASQPPVRLTTDGRVMRYHPVWSPDSKFIAISDKDGKLYVVDVSDKSTREIADDPSGQVFDYTWSPHSGHLAFSLGSANGMDSIYIWSAADQTRRKITSDRFRENEPVWDPNGKYLYYLSEREFAPQIGNQEWNFVQNRGTGIFALALRKDVPHPYPPEDDQVDEDDEDEDEDDDKDEEGDDDKDEKQGDDKSDDDQDSKDEGGKDEDDDDDEDESDEAEDPIVIDFAGLADRVTRVPVEADNLNNLIALDGHLLYEKSGAFYYGRESDSPTDLMIFSHEDREAETLREDISGLAVSPDGTHLLVSTESGFELMPAEVDAESEPISTDGLMVDISPREEWNQIFHEVWRRFRDFFYVSNMHGYDWVALRDKYEPLLEHVAHRSDLNYVIGEMIGELNVGHAYKAGGDFNRPTRPDVALPGAILKLADDGKRYQFEHIFKSHNEESIYRSPVTAIGVDIQEGDYLLAVDGVELTAEMNPYQLLRFKSDQPVALKVSSADKPEESREVTIRPISDEGNLVYLDWVSRNYDKVAEATDGEVGYFHLPDMGENGIREFNKWFYSQTRKKGLIVDVRSNGGGNVSQMVIDRLRRTLLATGFARTNDFASTYPETVFHGHLVCLLDEDSASDGDIFPAMFRRAKLGPLIGKRSWGGVIGITNRGTLIDGGLVYVPEFGFASTDGEWIIEGHGVDPDIEVDNDPAALIEGRDPQLERGVEEVVKMIKESPRSLPSRPAAPVKTP